MPSDAAAEAIRLDGHSLTLELLEAIAGGATVALADAARERVRAARAVVDRAADGEAPVYGINTGFGNFAEVRIPHDQLAELQLNLLRSHAAGVGEPLPVAVVRAMLALRANVLAKGFSGIWLETLELLVAMLNRGVHPVVPSRGSVGASGDLAPLAHLALVLIGEGFVWHDGPIEPGAAGLRRAGLSSVSLAPKEGLALINGTQASTALLGLTAAGARRLAKAADLAAALSIDGLQGSTKPFDPRIMLRAALPGLRRRPTTCAGCSRGAKSTPRTPTAAASRTPIPSAALRRCTARRATRWAGPGRWLKPRRMRPPTTRWCSPRPATSFQVATFTARRWRWQPIWYVWRWRNCLRSANEDRNVS